MKTDEELVDALVEAAYARSIGGVVGTGEYDVARAALLDRLRVGRAKCKSYRAQINDMSRPHRDDEVVAALDALSTLGFATDSATRAKVARVIERLARDAAIDDD